MKVLPTVAQQLRRGLVAGTTLAVVAGTIAARVVAALAASAAQVVPGHGSRRVRDKLRANTPRISNGEIWDIEVIGNRVFIAGSLTSLAKHRVPDHDDQSVWSGQLQHHHRSGRHEISSHVRGRSECCRGIT